MRAQLRAELLKLRSTRTGLGLVATMLGLVLLAVLLHGFGVAAENVGSTSEQLTMLFGRGEFLGALFAALSVTSEFRHGILPTLLVTRRVVAWSLRGRASMLIGAASSSVLALARGRHVPLGCADRSARRSDYALLRMRTGAALWAAIARLAPRSRQVPTLSASARGGSSSRACGRRHRGRRRVGRSLPARRRR